MKGLISIALVSLAIAGCNMTAQNGTNDIEKELPKTETTVENDLSYALGVAIGENLKNEGFVDLDYKGLAGAMEDVYEGKATMNAQEAQKVIQTIQQEQKSAQYSVNLEKSEKFLSENSTKEGVVITDSGLQYKVLQEGTGASPTTADRVTVHYVGTLVDGTPFDSSREINPAKGKTGKPASFGVTQVIKGWTEGLQLMKEGAIYEFYIHPDLGYGVNPRPGVIKPNDALVFNVELIKVN